MKYYLFRVFLEAGIVAVEGMSGRVIGEIEVLRRQREIGVDIARLDGVNTRVRVSIHQFDLLVGEYL